MAPLWSVLLPEILDMILQRLSLPDCFVFHKVCQSWRSVFLERRRLSRPPPCMLLMGWDETSGQLYGLNGGRFQKIKYPKLVIGRSETIVWSSKGWLLIVSNPSVSGLTMYLLNSASYKRILCPLSLLYSQSLCISHVAISSGSSSEYYIVAMKGRIDHYNHFFAWCRMGVDDKWNYFEDNLKPAFDVRGMVFHKDKLYILGDGAKFDVYTFQPQPERTYSGCILSTVEKGHLFKQQLVQSGGDLLYVRRRHEEPYMFDLFEQEEENGRWVRVKSLGDGVMLLGRQAQLICTQDLMGSGFERNCIYFTKNTSTKELVKYSLEDQSSQIISIPFAQDRFDWIVPQTW